MKDLYLTMNQNTKEQMLVIRDQLRAFLRSNKMVIFKMGESDAVVVNLDT